MEPNAPGSPVWIDVWFGTEPNETDPAYDMAKIIDANEDLMSFTVDVSTPDTYYWRGDSYLYGDPAEVDYDVDGNEPNVVKGYTWTINSVIDIPVDVEAGDNMVTWSGREVQLDASVVDDGVPELTWSADPNDGVVFDPNEFVEDPIVTITKATENPSVVTLTLTGDGGTSIDEDYLKIAVYDTACLAAIIDGGLLYGPGDFNLDCATDLGDYAALAEEWLVYNGLTESVVKP